MNAGHARYQTHGRKRDFVALSVSTAIRPQLPHCLPTNWEFGELLFASTEVGLILYRILGRTRCSVFSARVVSLIILLVFSLSWDNARSQDHPASHSVYPLSKFQPGQWVEKVSGDFTKPGESFVFRIHQDAGYITLPHTHPIDEYITVVKGTWSLGMGRRFNRSALELMDTGTFGIAPKNMAHFAWSKTETILQIHGIGPFSSTVIEPVYELNEKGVFLLTSLLMPGRATSSSPPNCFALKINSKVRNEAGEGIVVGARCSPSNQITQYWVQKSNGERFWATFQELKAL